MDAEGNSQREALESILRLRRAEQLSGEGPRREIAAARDYLERLVGSTLKPAEAARALGVSQPALMRWLDRGEIATVRTPQGRREIPLAELVGLLDEVEAVRREGSQRPLARVIKERNRRAHETVDVDKLLPPRRRTRGHRTAERQALAYHRMVADLLTPALVDEATRRLRRWERIGRIDPHWAEEWERLLVLPIARIAKAISADSERARELRQTSPLAGLLTTQERNRLVQAVEEQR